MSKMVYRNEDLDPKTFANNGRLLGFGREIKLHDAAEPTGRKLQEPGLEEWAVEGHDVATGEIVTVYWLHPCGQIPELADWDNADRIKVHD